MNTINVQGKALKIVKTQAPLFRADKTIFTVGYKASNNYRNAPMKYFTLNEDELKAYTKYGMPFKKTWQPTSELVLIDILDKKTRMVLADLIGKESLNIAFPVNKNKVSRISEEDTKVHNDNVLRSICSIDDRIDGYYMKSLSNNEGRYVFHSEVGLCPKAFHKLTLASIQRNATQAPSVGKRNTRRRRYNNNELYSILSNNRNNTRNNNNRYRRKRMFTNNNENIPSIRRLAFSKVF